uniref:Uncharacterized protein n=1 Tax=Cacopsylla melanoneura TaxID=428564 RepID=A0A8D9B8M1_9HEMI
MRHCFNRWQAEQCLADTVCLFGPLCAGVVVLAVSVLVSSCAICRWSRRVSKPSSKGVTVTVTPKENVYDTLPCKGNTTSEESVSGSADESLSENPQECIPCQRRLCKTPSGNVMLVILASMCCSC